jgi:dTDP-4-amino-4,6-dideoxygalactose transaminase
VLVDIEPGGFGMDPTALEMALRRPPPGRPAVVLPVHLYGEPVDLAAIGEIVRAHGLRLVEDCAQSHGATHHGRATGAIGDFGCFSFYPTKNLGALGDAGIVTTGDVALAAAAREIREYGWRERYVSARVGINTRLDPLQAAILAVKLPRLDADNRRRQAVAARYDDGLAGLPLILPPRRAGTSHVFHQYVVRSSERDRLREHLRTAAIGTGIHYPAPVHQHPAYRDRVPVGPAGLENSERAASEILSLPIYPQLSDAAVDRVIAEIRRFFG